MNNAGKAVFLDRDGTVIRDVGYLSAPEDVHLLPYAARGILRMRELGYRVVLVTNQSGIARGYFTEDDFKRVEARMEEELAARGAGLDAVYYCPHLPGGAVAAYAIECECRKPKPGLILRAARELGIDLGASVMVGDTEADIQAGRRAGCRTILLSTERVSLLIQPDAHAAHLLEAVEHLERWGRPK
ncbi:MAG: HAD family hydrolase [Planctomycetes bacterium]|nr:HAD family hydrolase [Planctomycetota bacterium]